MCCSDGVAEADVPERGREPTEEGRSPGGVPSVGRPVHIPLPCVTPHFIAAPSPGPFGVGRGDTLWAYRGISFY